jgi:hypothetical protein
MVYEPCEGICPNEEARECLEAFANPTTIPRLT